MRPSRLCLAVLCLAASLPALARPAPQGPPDPANVRPEQVFAAVSPQAVRGRLAAAAEWWPLLPEFNAGLIPPAPGQRFYVVQNYERVGDAVGGRIETVVTAYADAASAAADLDVLRRAEMKVSHLAAGPNVGALCYWFTRPGAGKDAPAAVTVRFQVGPFAGRVTRLSGRTPWPPSLVAPLASGIVANLRSVLAGKLTSEMLPPDIAEFAPPAKLLNGIGPLLGCAVVPVESWAIVDTAGTPARQRDLLRKLGASQLGYWRYRLTAHAGHAVEVTVFPLRDAASAQRWVKVTDDEVRIKKLERLNAGSTGPGAVCYFRPTGNGSFEMQFTKGRCAVSVYGWAPFAKTSRAIEPVVREAAERWYAALPE